MIPEPAPPPKVKLLRDQWLRLVLVGVLSAFVAARVVPDAIRGIEPLGTFGYVTDGDAIVVAAPAQVPKGSERIRVGDHVRIDRIPPFDRKPGLAGVGFTRENFERHLPVDRNGHALVLHLTAVEESPAQRALAVLRVLLFLITAGLGAILFLVRPGLGTFGFFLFTLGSDYPATFADAYVPNPWRPIPEWIGDVFRGASRAGLLLFALSLAFPKPRIERAAAALAGVLALVLGNLSAYATWRLTYAALPAQTLRHTAGVLASSITLATIAVFLYAYVGAAGRHRARIRWIVGSFAAAGLARLLSDQLFPSHIGVAANAVLLSITVVPVIVVWSAVVRDRLFNVDFVVSRAIVYVALTAALVGAFTVTEELVTYAFYNNTDLATGILVAISMAIAAAFGKVKGFFDSLVDRFIFRDRLSRQEALEYIAGYILDAESEDEVYRALLEDAPHALGLTFGGVMTAREDGSYVLTHDAHWPEDCPRTLRPNDDLARAINRSRGVMTFSDRESQLIAGALPGERLTFAAPLFLDRRVGAIVVYGSNVSGLDLALQEREGLIRIVAHASLTLTQIELARYRALAQTASLPA